MIQFILMSHGKMAQETYESAKMIVGESDKIEVVSMAAEDGLEGTKNKLEPLLEKYKDQKILILADLKGGTPCNVAIMYQAVYPNVRLLTGMNLAMVIEAVMSPIDDIDELQNYLQQVGQKAITKVEYEATMDDDLEEIDE